MKGPTALVVVLLVAVAVLAAGAEVADRIRSATPQARAEARAEELRDQVRELRPHLNACFDDLERAEGAFRAQERATEELHDRVREFEAMDDEGVPSDRYDEYLEVFDLYNASLPEWQRRAESVEAVSSTCRELAETHNAWADSLRDLLVEAEILDETFVPLPMNPSDDTRNEPRVDPPGGSTPDPLEG